MYGTTSTQRKSPYHGQRERNRRVDVRARRRAEYVDRGRDHQCERDRDDPEPRVVELALPHLERRDKRAGAEDHQQRCTDELGEEAASEAGSHDRSDRRA